MPPLTLTPLSCPDLHGSWSIVGVTANEVIYTLMVSSCQLSVCRSCTSFLLLSDLKGFLPTKTSLFNYTPHPNYPKCLGPSAGTLFSMTRALSLYVPRTPLAVGRGLWASSQNGAFEMQSIIYVIGNNYTELKLYNILNF